jgi:hypothetical protein
MRVQRGRFSFRTLFWEEQHGILERKCKAFASGKQQEAIQARNNGNGNAHDKRAGGGIKLPTREMRTRGVMRAECGAFFFGFVFLF